MALSCSSCFSGFHALSHCPHAQAVRQTHDRFHQRAGVVRAVHPLHELPVDLQIIDRQFLQVAQRGITGPKVVEGNADAQTLQFPELPGGFPDILHDHALGNFQIQLRGLQAGLGQRGRHGLGQIAARELHG
jgi:hypothetical protein